MNLLKTDKLKKLFVSLMVFNFLGLQVLTPAFGVNVTSVVVAKAFITTVLTGFSLNSTSVALGSAVPTIAVPTSNSPAPITYSSSAPAVATINPATGIIAIIGRGATIFTASQIATGNYLAATSTVALTVTALVPNLAGLGLSSPSVVFGATAPTITAPTSLSTGAITYTSATSGTATITTGGVISLVGVGTTVITATQAATANYASTTATTTLTVTGIVINTAAISGITIPVAGATPSTTAITGTGYTGTVAWVGTPSIFSSATSYTATVTLTAATNYTLTGVASNFFTVAGASTVTNSANSGLISVMFSATSAPAGYALTPALSGSGSLLWAPPIGGAASSSASYSINTAGAACSVFTANGISSGWRLPTAAELVGLVNTNGIAWIRSSYTGINSYPTPSSTSAGVGQGYYVDISQGPTLNPVPLTLVAIGAICVVDR